MVRAFCLLAILLVCAMGLVQAVHAHPDEATAPHHACSICSAAHAGLGIEIEFAPPALVASALVAPPLEFLQASRNYEVHFIRPPPAA